MSEIQSLAEADRILNQEKVEQKNLETVEKKKLDRANSRDEDMDEDGDDELNEKACQKKKSKPPKFKRPCRIILVLSPKTKKNLTSMR